MKYEYDLFVIGGGSGGVRAARWSASLGAKVALCESDRLGGTCVIRGCIPKKLMVYSAEFPKYFEYAQAYGWKTKKPHLDWKVFNQNRNKEIKRLEGVYTRLLKNASVRLISGTGELVDSHTVKVRGKFFTSRYILIATGARPRRLAIKGAQLALTSDDMFTLTKKPKSLLVIGAGYIALEFASIFNKLGTDVKVMFRRDKVLRGFDDSIREDLQNKLQDQGIKLLPGCVPLTIKKIPSGVCVVDNKKKQWNISEVLMATGRAPNTEELNLKAAGICTNKEGAILVNKKWATSCSNVFAVGDVASTPYALTPVAIAEGMALSEMLFAKKKNDTKKKFSYENIPTAVFTSPPVGTVGLTELQARQKGFQVTVYESRFRHLKLTLTSDPEKTYIKLIVCKKTDKVLGCHIIGVVADEILQGFAVAINIGLKKQQLDRVIGIHPTSAEELVTMRN